MCRLKAGIELSFGKSDKKKRIPLNNDITLSTGIRKEQSAVIARFIPLLVVKILFSPITHDRLKRKCEYNFFLTVVEMLELNIINS